jgi:uncharacterized protein (TIGR03437 family)
LGGVTIAVSTVNSILRAPTSVLVGWGSNAASFALLAGSFTSSQSGSITAAFNGASRTVPITLAVPSVTSADESTLSAISCAPKTLTKGRTGICRVTLGNVDNADVADLQLTSSSPALQLPGRVVTRRGQSIVEFRVDAVDVADGIAVTANLGAGTATETVTIAPDQSRKISVPGRQFVKYGSEVRFQVTPGEHVGRIFAESLPAGAHFDSLAGEFRWTPDGTQLGAHEIGFSATDATGLNVTATVNVQVDSGEPIATGIVNAATRSSERACGPGAIAALQGRWLINGTPSSDPSGSALSLAGAKVWINGNATPVLSASSAEVTVLCPDVVPGTVLEFVVETDHGIAKPVSTIAQEAAAGLYSLDGSGEGQGLVMAEDGRTLVMIPNYRITARPASPGDQILIYATGIDALKDVSVEVGGIAIAPSAISTVAGHVGLSAVTVALPRSLVVSGPTSLTLTGSTPRGIGVRTNALNIAVEPSSR